MTWQDQSPETLLAGLDPDASRAERHLWLIALIEWLRGPESDVPATLKRLGALLDAAEADPSWLARWRLWWRRLRQDLDLAPLLADFGFASQSAFMTELGHRIRRKLLPTSPVTSDMSELFGLLFHDPLDARWLAALPARQLEQLGALLGSEPEPSAAPGDRPASRLSGWEQTLMDALSFCIGQVSATGFRPELRSRMSVEARQARSVSDVNRQRIQGAIRHRLRRAPLSFLWPVSAQQETQAHADADIAPPENHEDEPSDGRV